MSNILLNQMHWALAFLAGTLFYCWSYQVDLVEQYYDLFKDDPKADQADALKSIAVPPFWLVLASAAILFSTLICFLIDLDL